MNNLIDTIYECTGEAFGCLSEGLSRHWVAGAIFAALVVLALS